VRISGDATLALDIERLFSRLDLDWEAELSRWLGDVIGYQVAAGARGALEQLRAAAADFEEMTGEQLRRAGGMLAQQADIRAFSDAVDELRDATSRLEAKLRILRVRRERENGEETP
jgi:ubiquinone biosynthesis protein UbiJ